MRVNGIKYTKIICRASFSQTSDLAEVSLDAASVGRGREGNILLVGGNSGGRWKLLTIRPTGAGRRRDVQMLCKFSQSSSGVRINNNCTVCSRMQDCIGSSSPAQGVIKDHWDCAARNSPVRDNTGSTRIWSLHSSAWSMVGRPAAEFLKPATC